MTRSIALAAAAAFLGLGAAPAMAQDEPPAEVNTKYFFQCADSNKVRNNLGAAPWTAQAPTTSYTAGGGCGFLDQTLLVSTVGGGNDLVDAVFEGTHTGPVSDLTVELHDLLLTQAESASGGDVSFEAILEIDGVPVVDTTNINTAASPTPSSSGLSQSIRFSINNLKVKDAEEHFYRLTINKYYIDTAAAWVFGATEIPAGIEFNPAKTVLPTIKAPNTPPASASSKASKAKRGAKAKRVKRSARASARR